MNKDINVMIKAIMLDVDGTLVSFETHKVLPSSVDALRKIHDGGIRIVIATGRAAGDLHEIADVPYDGIRCFLITVPSSVDALRKIHDGGIRIVIATGRAAGDLQDRKSVV